MCKDSDFPQTVQDGAYNSGFVDLSDHCDTVVARCEKQVRLCLQFLLIVFLSA